MRRIICTLLVIFFGCGIAFAQQKNPRFKPTDITWLEVSKDGHYAAIGRLDHTVTIWDLENKKLVFHEKTKYLFRSFGFGHDLKYFFMRTNPISTIHEIHLRDISTGEVISKIPYQQNPRVYAAFSDGKRVIAGNQDGSINLIDLETKEIKVIRRKPKKDLFFVLDLILSQDESVFLSLNYCYPSDDPETGEKIKQKSQEKYQSWQEFGVTLWDSKTFKVIKKFGAKDFCGMCWGDISSDNKRIVVASENGVTYCLNLKTGEMLWGPIRYKGKDGNYYYKNDRHHMDGIGFLNDGKVECELNANPGDKTLSIWDAYANELVTELKLPAKVRSTGKLQTVSSKNLIILTLASGTIGVWEYLPEKKKLKAYYLPKPPPLSKESESDKKREVELYRFNLPFPELDQFSIGFKVYQPQDNVGIVEYVPKGQTVNNWKNIIILQEHVDIDTTDLTHKKYYEESIKNRKTVNSKKVESSVIEETDKEIIYEMQTYNNDGGLDEYAVSKIFIGKNKFWNLIYSTKEYPVSQEQKEKMVKFIKEASFKN